MSKLSKLFLEKPKLCGADQIAMSVIMNNGSSINSSWDCYSEMARFVARYLHDNKIGNGDFVAIVPLNLPSSFVVMWGIILAGAVVVPINPHLVKERGLEDIKKILDDCQPEMVLANSSIANYLKDHNIEYQTIEELIYLSFEHALDRVRRFNFPEKGEKPIDLSSVSGFDQRSDVDLLIMPYTSGTSGKPKGVMLSSKNIYDRVLAINTALKTSSKERIISYLPLGHISELIATFFGQAHSGYTVFFTESAYNTVLNREEFKQKFQSVIQAVKPTVFLAVPKIWESFRIKIEKHVNESQLLRYLPKKIIEFLIKKRLGFSSVKIFISAGDKLNPETRDFFSSWNIRINDIYGQTETAGPLLLDGAPLNTNVYLLDGEIVVTGGCAMLGYYRDPEKSHRVLRPDLGISTRYHTGDTGIECDGKIFWTGRLDDVFKLSNGEKIDPLKKEQLEKQIKLIDPRISEVIVCGDHKPYLVALIFSNNFLDAEILEKIKSALPHIGEGIYNPKKFMLLNSAGLEFTPTLKLKRKAMLEKLKLVIDSMFIANK